MKANVKTKEVLQVVSDALNEAQFLFSFDVEVLPNRIELNVSTDEKDIQFTCANPAFMENFLEELKALVPYHQDDIEELLAELSN